MHYLGLTDDLEDEPIPHEIGSTGLWNINKLWNKLWLYFVEH